VDEVHQPRSCEQSRKEPKDFYASRFVEQYELQGSKSFLLLFFKKEVLPS
jgi:hypothetical protein